MCGYRNIINNKIIFIHIYLEPPDVILKDNYVKNIIVNLNDLNQMK